jgi:hypothetical protein
MRRIMWGGQHCCLGGGLMLVKGVVAGQGRQGGATWFLGSPEFEVAGEQKEVKLTNQTHVAWNGEQPKGGKRPTSQSMY